MARWKLLLRCSAERCAAALELRRRWHCRIGINTTFHCILCQSFSGSHFYELSGSFPSGRVLAAWA